jgi:hypothetical protein
MTMTQQTTVEAASQRAHILRTIAAGESLATGARSISVTRAKGMRLLGVDDPDKPVAADLRRLIGEMFGAKKIPLNRIVSRTCLSYDRVTQMLAEDMPLELARRLMNGGASQASVRARFGLAESIVAEAMNHLQTARSATAYALCGSSNRIKLQTKDGFTTISTEAGQIAGARRIMTALAKGRAWSEAVA